MVGAPDGAGHRDPVTTSDEDGPTRWGDKAVAGWLIVLLPLWWCGWSDDPQSEAEKLVSPPYAGTPLGWVLSYAWLGQLIWCIPAALWMLHSGRRRAFRGLVIAMLAVAALNGLVSAFNWGTRLYQYLL